MLSGRRRLELATRWLRSRWVGGGLILGYHRISDVAWDPFSLSVSSEHFAQHLEILRARARPLTLADLVRSLDGRPRPGGIALTFDDGYADNLSRAKPLLTKHGVPATIFVTTAHGGSEFWWDALSRLLSPGNKVPETIRLSVSKERCTWQVPPDLNDVHARRRLLFSIYGRLQALPPPEIGIIIEELSRTVSTGSPGCPPHRALTAEEVAEVAEDGLVDIGAHGKTHSFLAQLSLSDQESEIKQSKDFLERLLRRPILGFSYPNGSVSVETMTLVRGAGFAFACASQTDVASSRSNRFRLPRFWIPNWDGQTFSRWLTRWLPNMNGPL
jgi:peptidoglycan/xylan/chitin deacetylase (PgdA/CDA1 family)